MTFAALEESDGEHRAGLMRSGDRRPVVSRDASCA